VTGVAEDARNAVAQSDRLTVASDGTEEVDTPEDVGHVVQRRLRCLASAAGLAGAIRRFFDLQMSGIGEHQLGDLRRRLGAQDLPGEPSPDEQGEPPCVIEVGVGEEDGVDLPRVEGERLPIEVLALTPSLEQAAVKKETESVDLDEVTRAGDRLRRAAERDLHSTPRCYVGVLFYDGVMLEQRDWHTEDNLPTLIRWT